MFEVDLAVAMGISAEYPNTAEVTGITLRSVFEDDKSLYIHRVELWQLQYVMI